MSGKRASEGNSFCAGGALCQNPRGSIHARTVAIALLGGKKPCPVTVQCPVQKLKSSPFGTKVKKVKVKGRGMVLLLQKVCPELTSGHSR